MHVPDIIRGKPWRFQHRKKKCNRVVSYVYNKNLLIRARMDITVKVGQKYIEVRSFPMTCRTPEALEYLMSEVERLSHTLDRVSISRENIDHE